MTASMCRTFVLLACLANSAAAWSQPQSSQSRRPQKQPLAHVPANTAAAATSSRRDVLLSTTTAAALLAFIVPTPNNSNANAAITDETETFAAPDSAYSYRGMGGRFDTVTPPESSSATSNKTNRRQQSTAVTTDEYTITISKDQLQQNSRGGGGGLGLELADITFRTNRRVYVKSVRPNSLADRMGIQRGWVLVSVNGHSAERTNAEGAAVMVSRSVRGDASNNEGSQGGGGADSTTNNNTMLELRFRDPSAFQEQLRNLSPDQEVTTQVAPSGDTSQRRTDGTLLKRGSAETSQANQKLSVQQLIPPKLCKRGATVDDLLEISYLGTVLETNQIFDGSAIKVDGKAIPGRGNDVSLFFVLGKQPFGQFPPGWDAGLEGMCVGERRRLVVPPVLAYGSVGVPRRGIPPDATLQYDITLVSINGLATPQ